MCALPDYRCRLSLNSLDNGKNSNSPFSKGRIVQTSACLSLMHTIRSVALYWGTCESDDGCLIEPGAVGDNKIKSHRGMSYCVVIAAGSEVNLRCQTAQPKTCLAAQVLRKHVMVHVTQELRPFVNDLGVTSTEWCGSRLQAQTTSSGVTLCHHRLHGDARATDQP